MKKEEKLREEYEDAYLALLMSEVAKAKGAELLKENERLKADPDFEVPESVTKRSMTTIRREFTRQTGKKTVRFAGRIFTRVACVAVLAVLMLVTAYATIPSFRLEARNFIMESTSIETFISLKEESIEENPNVLLGYQIPEMPEGFVMEDMWEGKQRAWIMYVSDKDQKIKIHISRNMSHTIAADTEDAEAETIQIHNCDGFMSVEGQNVLLIWNDKDADTFIHLSGEGVSQSIMEALANEILPAAQ